MPYPQNVQTAREVEQIIRDNGAVPATIALIDGQIKIGLSDEELKCSVIHKVLQKHLAVI